MRIFQKYIAKVLLMKSFNIFLQLTNEIILWKADFNSIKLFTILKYCLLNEQ